MATNSSPSFLTASLRFHVIENLSTKKCDLLINSKAAKKKSFTCRSAQSEKVNREEQSVSGSPARSQLDLLQQLTSSTDRQVYESEVDRARPTIREQLADLSRGRNGDFTLPLGEKLKESLKSLNILTISRRRNIKRQEYLNIVSGRNDAVFFATIGAFVVLPPLAILAVAIQNGYVQLFH
ncbi:hypothetical protein HPP92_009854 [Vanilla planifolia]|uniref:Uncharacterized protein n=1 Tax=Vanilla planifolia TaxID=51239 RepID=A0A835RB21_VANPL|nr:hypothetical protein HPP92_009854 [Vanilla planifolia]